MTSQRSLNEKLIAETRAKVEQEIADWLEEKILTAKKQWEIITLYRVEQNIRTSSYRKETT